MPFLQNARVRGGACARVDLDFGDPISHKSIKATSMTNKQPTLIDIIRGASIPERHKALDEIKEAAKHLPTEELKVLNHFLPKR